MLQARQSHYGRRRVRGPILPSTLLFRLHLHQATLIVHHSVMVDGPSDRKPTWRPTLDAAAWHSQISCAKGSLFCIVYFYYN